jgi:methyltransferase (TIGR00027 family)
MSELGAIRDVSDTALWVAMYRALESERPDALFRDEHARRLAGERGAAILDALPGGKSTAWPMVVRTRVFDELILGAVRERGALAVVSLAAGLDTRPYRLDLPPSLRWLEIDLPGMIDYKQKLLAGAVPRCRLEREALDLSDLPARRALFDRLDASGEPTLVVTEGLLIYLETEAVTSLAYDLHERPSLRWWLVDFASPDLLRMLEKRWGASLRGRADLKFATAEGTAFFTKRGWDVAADLSALDEARRLKREMPFAWLWRFFGLFVGSEIRERWRRYSTFALLERS